MIEDPAPEGQIVLVDYFKESASGHYDERRKVTLAAGRDINLTLNEVTAETDQYKLGTERSDKSWTIDRELLIELIQKHGTRKLR